MSASSTRLLLTCEHASGAVPDGLDLGVDASDLASHIAFDRGALVIAEGLRAGTGAPLHRGAFSRLVVDLNRMDDNPMVMAAASHGVAVPANAALDEAGRQARLDAWHRPWRAAVLEDAVALAATGHCLHLSIHSFDPAVDPPNRGFDAGVLFDPSRAPERDHAVRLQDALRGAGFDARLNDPFAGTPEGTTSWLRSQIAEASYTGIELEASYAWVDDPGRVVGYVDALLTAIAELTGAIR